MSQVITISRPMNKSPLTHEDITQLIESDDSLSYITDKGIQWKSPKSEQLFYINLEQDSLWSDNISLDITDAFLEKLQSISKTLNARIIGEEGDDLSDITLNECSEEKFGITGTLGCITSVASLPIFLILFIVRLPLLVWKVYRATK